MSALPERVRQQAELANQLAAKAKAGTMTFEDMNAAGKRRSAAARADRAAGRCPRHSSPSPPVPAFQVSAPRGSIPSRLAHSRPLPPLRSRLRADDQASIGTRSCRASTTPRCRASSAR